MFFHSPGTPRPRKYWKNKMKRRFWIPQAVAETFNYFILSSASRPPTPKPWKTKEKAMFFHSTGTPRPRKYWKNKGKRRFWIPQAVAETFNYFIFFLQPRALPLQNLEKPMKKQCFFIPQGRPVLGNIEKTKENKGFGSLRPSPKPLVVSSFPSSPPHSKKTLKKQRKTKVLDPSGRRRNL